MKRASTTNRGDARVSIVVPVFDEEACLRELHRRLAALALTCEIIFVDDGSRDGSFDVVTDLATRDTAVRGVRLARNVGSQRALVCGMRAARGDVVVTLDADLQHPPELIPSMLDAWRCGHDVVEMVRARDTPNGPARDLLTPAFYRAFNAISPVPIDPRSTDFRLLDRACVDGLVDRPGELVRAMVGRSPASRTTIEFDAPSRFAGRSRYGMRLLATTAIRALWAATTSRFGVAPIAAPVSIERIIGSGL